MSCFSAKMATRPNLLLSGSGITPRKTERLEPSGNETSHAMDGRLDLSRGGSGPLEEIMQVATRWSRQHFSQFTYLKTTSKSTIYISSTYNNNNSYGSSIGCLQLWYWVWSPFYTLRYPSGCSSLQPGGWPCLITECSHSM